MNTQIISELNLLNKTIDSSKIELRWRLGFAKNAQQNFQLLNEFWKLNQMGYPILSGLSRKRFIGEALNAIPAQERLVGSVVGHLLSIQQGASIVRAHDVKATSDAINVWKMMFNQ